MSRPWSGVPRTITASFPVSNDMRCRGAKGKVHPFGRIHNDLYLPFIAHQALTHDLFAIFTTLTANFRTPTLQASTRTDYSHGLSISFLTNLHREASNEEISTFDRFTSFHPLTGFTQKLDLDMLGLTTVRPMEWVMKGQVKPTCQKLQQLHHPSMPPWAFSRSTDWESKA